MLEAYAWDQRRIRCGGVVEFPAVLSQNAQALFAKLFLIEHPKERPV